ncbi:hypothetical protein Daus18300_007278 [Diaporthe australafricana]|uniref:HOOK N-terminal domain-containing protein n=1 Tax=Diaporthe australafricana TaxID=127596 RepID=A0ABR3WNZ0_9PEZI
MPFSPAAQGALLKWVNTFPDEGQPAQSVDDLADGIVLGQVLHELDPTYDTSELDKNLGGSKWLAQKRNLQSVYKGLFKYMRREAPECVPLAQVADFRAIAENPDADGLAQVPSPEHVHWDMEPLKCEKKLTRIASKLAAVFLAAAVMYSNESVRTRAINKLQTDLGAVEQNEIRRILEQKQQQMQQLTAKAKEEDAAGERDPDLENEEELVRLTASLEKKVQELDAATKRTADLNNRHTHLQDSYDDLKAKLKEVETELGDLRKLHGADESQQVQTLQQKIDEQANLIASQEEELETYKSRQRQMQHELEKYKASSEEGKDYKDMYDELHHQMQELERKANAADRYKQKLATNRNYEQEVAGLQFELDSRKELDTQLQQALKERRKLQTSEREMLVAMTTIETSLNDQRDRTEQYKQICEELKLQNAQLEHLNNVNEKYMADLKDQLAGAGEVPRAPSPSSQTGEVGGNLESELQQTTNDFSKVKLLEAEVEVLRHGAATATQADDLRRELDRMKAERDVATSSYNSIFEKHGVAQEQIDALIANMSGEGLVNAIDEALKLGSLGTLTSDYNRHIAYNSMREQIGNATREIDDLKRQNRRLEEAAKDKDRENLAMKTDRALMDDPKYHLGEHNTDSDGDSTVDAVGSDRLDALERLKQSDQLIAASLRSEIESLRSKYNSLEIENNMHKSQLLDALVAKEKLSKERELEGPPANVAPEGVSQAELDDRVKDYKSKTDKLKDRVKLQKEASLLKARKTFDPLATVTSVRSDPGPQRESWVSEDGLRSARSDTDLSNLDPVVEGQPSGQPSTGHNRSEGEGEPSVAQTPVLLRRVTPPPEDLAWQKTQKKRKGRNWFSRFKKSKA